MMSRLNSLRYSTRAILLVAVLLLASTPTAYAQRAIGVGKLVIDDGAGHTITLQAPAGMGTSYNYLLPMPPAGSTSAGFVDPGTANGQTLYWNGTAWVPSVLMVNNNSNLGLGYTSIPGSFAFPITLHANMGPDLDNTLNLGDATHRFNTIYASNIIGPSGFTNYWQRVGTTLSPATSGDVISGDGSGLTNLNAAAMNSPVAVANGGTGATTAATAINNLLPSQGGNSGKILSTNGTTASWQTVSGTGTVTSIDVSGGTTGLTTSGGPVTTSGAIALAGTLVTSNGGTGLTSSGAAGQYLRSNGTAWTSSTIQVADVPTLNQNTTGTASNVTGTVAIANGGTGATTAAAALNNLLPSQGGNSAKVLTTNGTTSSWQTVSGTGTVTSVDVSGGSTGLTTSGGPVTGSGTIAIAGALNETHGGTNQTSYTTGDLLYASGANTLSRLAIGASGQVLAVQSGVPAWVTGAGGMTNPMSAMGDIIYSSGNSGTPARLAGQTTTTKKFLTQTGDGANSSAPAWGTIGVSDVPTLNQNTTGTAANVSGTVAIANGGTGATTQQSAIDALAGTQSSGKYLRSDGTHSSLATIQAADVPTLNQSTTGTAANVTGTVAIANGGTGATTQQAAIDALAGTQSSGKYLRSDGTHTSLASLQAADVPTLNQNTTGTAANVTGTIAIANGGTGQTSQQTAMNVLAGAVTNAKFLRGDGTNVTMASIQSSDVPTLNQNTTGTASNVTGTVAIANGGSGQTSQQSAINALAGAVTNAKFLRGDGTNITMASIQASDVPTLNQNTTGTASNVTAIVAVTNGGTGSATANASTVFAGPVSGIAGAPSFRALAATDIPSLSTSYITNTSSLQSSANFNISGNGYIGGSAGIGTTTPGASLEVVGSSNAVSTPVAIVRSTGSQIPLTFQSGSTQEAYVKGDNGGNLAFGAQNFIAWEAGGFGGGNEKMRITSTGLVGIGTSSPATMLDVNGVANAASGFRIANAATSGNYLRGNGTNFVSSGIQAADVPAGSVNYIQNSSSLQSSSNFNISGNGYIGGNVGIGTTSPGALLHVSSSANSEQNIFLQNASTSSSAFSAYRVGESMSSDSKYLEIAYFNSGFSIPPNSYAMPSEAAIVTASSASNGMVLATNANAPIKFVTNGSPANNERMRIDGSGNVGIGTTSPQNLLDVRSSSTGVSISAVSTSATDYSQVVAGANDGIAPTVHQLAFNTSASGTQFGFNRAASALWYADGSTLTNFAIGSINAVPLTFGTNNTARLTIDGSGNVGMNTSAPSQLLEVKSGNVLLSNAGTAGQLQMQGTSSGVSTFAAGAQGSTTINYTLPTTQPSANQVLTASSISGSGPYAVTLGWAAASGGSSPLFAAKSTDQSYSTTTLTDDSHLALALSTSATYTFEGFLAFFDTFQNVSQGAKIAFTVPNGSTIKWGVTSSGGSFTSNSVASASGAAITAVPIENANATDETFVYVKGIVITSSNSGNLKLQCAKMNGGTLKLRQNSYIIATRVQ